MSCQQVPTAPAFNPYPRSVQVGEFEVAIGGGIWVAIGAMLNERLAGRDFIATDRFSVADITAVVAVDFARVVKQKPGEQHPHLLRWRAAMAVRPSMSL